MEYGYAFASGTHRRVAPSQLVSARPRAPARPCGRKRCGPNRLAGTEIAPSPGPGFRCLPYRDWQFAAVDVAIPTRCPSSWFPAGSGVDIVSRLEKPDDTTTRHLVLVCVFSYPSCTQSVSWALLRFRGPVVEPDARALRAPSASRMRCGVGRSSRHMSPLGARWRPITSTPSIRIVGDGNRPTRSVIVASIPRVARQAVTDFLAVAA